MDDKPTSKLRTFGKCSVVAGVAFVVAPHQPLRRAAEPRRGGAGVVSLGKARGDGCAARRRRCDGDRDRRELTVTFPHPRPRTVLWVAGAILGCAALIFAGAVVYGRLR